MREALARSGSRRGDRTPRPPGRGVFPCDWINAGTSAKTRATVQGLNTTMSDTPPDRLASNPKSPFYDEAVLARGVGIRFKGEEKTNVDEYCVSEGWVRLAVGKTLDRHGNPMTVKLQGTVEPYFRNDAGE